MPVEIKVDNTGFNDPDKLFDNILEKVNKVVDDTLDDYVKTAVRQWRTASSRSQVPGSFSGKWKTRKAELGFRTEDLQRLGKTDSRSYYRNIVGRRFQSGRGWFIGVLTGTPAYVLSAEDKIVRNTKYDLSWVAERLEEHFPIWKEIHSKAPKIIRRRLRKNLIEMFHSFGAGDAG